MRPIPSHIIRSLEIEMPQFVSVAAASREEVVSLPWTFLDGESELLYNCVWYAICHGKRVLIEGPEI